MRKPYFWRRRAAPRARFRFTTKTETKFIRNDYKFMAREIKKLKYTELDGLSEKQLKEHHNVLYAGYVKKIGEIEEKLKSVDLSSANATYSDLRELKIEETFALNGVKLHEGYFDNMAKGGVNPSGKIMEMISRDFGSYEN